MTTVVVVGAGIVGAAVAYESARAGAEVVLLERSLPGSGATGDSFAWIGGPRGADVPDAASPLRRRALADHRRLETELTGVVVRRHGSLVGDGDLAGPRQLGPDEHLVDADAVRRLEPNLTAPPSRALRVDSDGAVDPVAVTEALVRGAESHGARVALGCAVTALSVRDGRVVGVETSVGFVAADTVVVAAGVDTPALLAPLGLDLRVRPSPALLLRFAAPPGLVRTLVVTPDLEVRQDGDGLLLVAAAYRGEVGRDDLDRAGAETLRRLTATFSGAQGVRLVDVRVGIRPMPADGLPVVGPVPGVGGAYVAVMHSGVTLGPTVGRLVAAEVVRGVEAAELAGVRPGRFRRDPTAPSVTG